MPTTPSGMMDLFAMCRGLGLRNAPNLDDPEALRAVARTWAALLPDISDDDAKAALVRYLRDPSRCVWWPAPGQILDYAHPLPVDDWATAWGEVMNITQSGDVPAGVWRTGRSGRTGDLFRGGEIRQRRIADALHDACGYWPTLRDADTIALGQMRATFRDSYRARLEQHKRQRNADARLLPNDDPVALLPTGEA